MQRLPGIPALCRYLMSIQSQENKIDAQREDADTTSAAQPAPKAPRPAPSVSVIRRRAVLVALGILVFLLVVGLGDALGGYLPHTTTPFANGSTQSAGAIQVTLQFTPNPPKVSGDPATQVDLLLEDQHGQAIDGARVQVSLVMVTMDMGVNETTAQGQGQGRYQARVAFLMPGAWQVTVNVSPPGGASASTTFAVDVAS